MTRPLLEDKPWDPGLQTERTRLAWQRTTLSGLTCSLLVARLLAEVSVVLAVAVGAAAVISSLLLGVTSGKRYTDNQVALHTDGLTAGGRAHLVLTGLIVVTAVGASCYVLTR